MNQIKFYKELNKVYSLQFKNSFGAIPKGQINYHTKNYCRFLDIKLNNFKKFNILETGGGPGVHAAILALMGAKVTATDILKSNIKKMKKFKKKYKLNYLTIKQHDFTKKLTEIKNFDLICCHNWVQHAKNPSLALKNLTQFSKLGTKIYLSCYQSKTFRFYISHIARQILKPEDLILTKKRIKIIFSDGFKKYKSREDIYAANITDDFFSPMVVTVDYRNIIKLTKNYGLKVYLKKILIKNKKNLSIDMNIPNKKTFYHRDNVYIKLGLKKYFQTTCVNKNNLFKKPDNEFLKSNVKVIDDCTELAKEIIKDFKKKKIKPIDRVNFCLSLYKIRANNNKEVGYKRYAILKKFLTNYLKAIT